MSTPCLQFVNTLSTPHFNQFTVQFTNTATMPVPSQQFIRCRSKIRLQPLQFFSPEKSAVDAEIPTRKAL
ncbi:hypothetical protein [Nostoc piscinale]|uniref:hypothetical protein n=1 Tax=Nostoc piscinale TaxID=224012 RepID=UPI000B123E2F|nr:hypothetical protein [Nostoc piscinale]